MKKWHATTDSHHPSPIAANTLSRQFKIEQPTRGAGDIIDIWTAAGWVYRAVIAWALGARLTGDLAQEALTMAIHHRTLKSGFLHRSDRGSQDAATAYQQLLTTQA